MPLISVVIPTYNRAEYLLFSLYLYTKQTMKDFEIIVVDDGSQDNTAEVCAKFKTSLNIRYFKSERKNVPCSRSGGPLINFAVKNVATADIILYSDPEVMPLPDFVENHYEAHMERESKCVVKGLTLKTWQWFSHILGSKESWMCEAKLVDIQEFWDTTWNIVREKEKELFDAIPQYLIGDRSKGFEYPGGEQWFWGFQGSQAGMSFPKDVFIEIGGWDEQIDIPGRWTGEDAELGSRMTKHGIASIEEPKIRAVHVYHQKPAVYTDMERKELITNRVEDQRYMIANIGEEWGSKNKLKIKEIQL